MLYNEIPDIVNFVESYAAAETMGDGARYISNFPAGMLLVT